MNFFSKLERKLGKYAIHNLMMYILVLYAIGFFVMNFQPQLYLKYFALDASAIFKGQVWRIFTFLICPPSTDFLYFLIEMWLYFILGRTLEMTWGAFRFNIYFIGGVLGHVLGAIIIYLVTGNVILLDTTYLNLSLFFAFAATYPEMQFYLFFFIPVKAKWMGLISGALCLFSFLSGNFATKAAIALSLINFLIFFFLIGKQRVGSPKEIKRKIIYKQEVEKARTDAARPRHRCHVCGRTEYDDPNLEFRFCSKCEGAYEYCSDHLYTHVHITADNKENIQ